jgi:hypothetical protein
MEKYRHYRHQGKGKCRASTRFIGRFTESPAGPATEGKEGPLTTTSRDRITERGRFPPQPARPSGPPAVVTLLGAVANGTPAKCRQRPTIPRRYDCASRSRRLLPLATARRPPLAGCRRRIRRWLRSASVAWMVSSAAVKPPVVVQFAWHQAAQPARAVALPHSNTAHEREPAAEGDCRALVVGRPPSELL